MNIQGKNGTGTEHQLTDLRKIKNARNETKRREKEQTEKNDNLKETNRTEHSMK